ncbi:MAG: ATP-binding protein [Oscillospiraceae bacterium]|nr:ATP-binding protein [Oscillospiraceae bacterium]
MGEYKELSGEWKELTLDAVIDNVEPLTEIVDDMLESMDCPMKVQAQLDIAIDEIFSNIVKYAYAPETGTAVVRIETCRTPASITMTFKDRGVAYNPLARKDPNVTLSLDEREIGGLGIFLVKKSMDRMSYRRRGSQNVLTVYKKF